MCNALLCESEFQNMSCREKHFFRPAIGPSQTPLTVVPSRVSLLAPQATPCLTLLLAASRRSTFQLTHRLDSLVPRRRLGWRGALSAAHLQECRPPELSKVIHAAALNGARWRVPEAGREPGVRTVVQTSLRVDILDGRVAVIGREGRGCAGPAVLGRAEMFSSFRLRAEGVSRKPGWCPA